jgi:hypothetical protein
MESISGWEAVKPQTFSETSSPIPSIVNYERDREQERELEQKRNSNGKSNNLYICKDNGTTNNIVYPQAL